MDKIALGVASLGTDNAPLKMDAGVLLLSLVGVVLVVAVFAASAGLPFLGLLLLVLFLGDDKDEKFMLTRSVRNFDGGCVVAVVSSF